MTVLHPKTRAKTLEITKTILDLVASGLMTWAALGSLKNIKRSEKVLGALTGYSSARIYETMQRLKMQDMIQYNEDDIKSPIILTRKGMARRAKQKLKDLFKSKKRWDYFWRIIFFDIPERKRHLRDHLRRELIVSGFYPFQRSVYVCPFDCEDVINNLCKIHGISGHVLFCITPSLGKSEETVREFFFQRGRSSRRAFGRGDKTVTRHPRN